MSVTVLGARPLPRTLQGSKAAVRPHVSVGFVTRRVIPYWQELGWVRQGNQYAGNYQTRFGTFSGLVEDRGWGDLRFYIFDPPTAVRHSSHWQCFQPRREKGYHVHMGVRPADVSSGIMVVERLITQAFENGR